jgi:hypothetical protein
MGKRNALLEFAEITLASTGATSTAYMYVGKHLQGPNMETPKLVVLQSLAGTGGDATTALTIALAWNPIGSSTDSATDTVQGPTLHPVATGVAGYQVAALRVPNFKDEYVKVTFTVTGTAYTTGGKLKVAFVPDAQTNGI